MKSNTKKRLIAFMLCMVLVLSSATSAFADEPQNTDSQSQTEVVTEPVADEAQNTDSQSQAEVVTEPAADEATEDTTTEDTTTEDTTTEDVSTENTITEDVSDTPDIEIPSKKEWSVQVGNATVKVNGSADALPADAQLSVTEITSEDEVKEIEKAVEEKAIEEQFSIKNIFSYDIKFLVNGSEVQPTTPVQVSVDTPEITSSENAAVLHVDDNNVAEDMKGAVDGEGKVVFDAPHFSKYVIVQKGNSKVNVTIEYYDDTQNPKTMIYASKKELSPGESISNYDIADNWNINSAQKSNATGGFDWISTSEEIQVVSDCTIKVYCDPQYERFPGSTIFYDYTVKAGIGGILGDSYYSFNQLINDKSPRVSENKKLIAGTNDPNNGQNYSEYQKYTISLPSSLPDSNVGPTKDANNYTGGDSTIPGLLKKIDDKENVIFNYAEPGFFVDSNYSINYRASWNSRAEERFLRKVYKNYTLVFNRNGDTYTLSGVEDGGKNWVTGAGNNFYPLDKVLPSYEESERGNNHNNYFGMRYDVTFKIGDYVGPLNYKFTGDDDLWVVLDGKKIVIDLGGIHSAATGNVDLWNYIGQAANLTEAQKQQTHTLTILYMERGAGASNCQMEFTLPSAKIQQVDQTKMTNISFYKTDAEGNGLPGAEFTLTNDSTNDIKYATSDKDGLVQFQQLVAGTYTLTETQAPNGYVTPTTSWKVKVTADSSHSLSARIYLEDGKTELGKLNSGGYQIINSASTPVQPPTPGIVETKKELSHEKYIAKNDDGTYNLTLNVSGAVGSESYANKLDVLFVMDTSNSMMREMNSKNDLNDYTTNENSRFFNQQKAVEAAVAKLKSKKNVDAQFAVVSFDTQAGIETEWTKDSIKYPTGVGKYPGYSKQAGGTNYEAGLIKAKQLLDSGRTDATKIVVFLSDGDPTFYYKKDSQGNITGIGGKGNSYNDTAMVNAQTQLSKMSMNYFYTVGVGPEDSYNHLSSLISNAPSGTVTGSYNGTDSSNLKNAFDSIIRDATELLCTEVTVTDTLTDEVELADQELQVVVKDETGKVINKLKNASGNEVDVSDIITTQTQKDSDGKTQIIMRFKSDYKLESGYTYYVTAKIQPTTKAYLKYQNESYTDTGDENTDEYLEKDKKPGKDTKNEGTSSKQKGFYSNVSANVTYKYNNETYEKPYAKPVIQVNASTVSHTVVKQWETDSDKVAVDVDLKAYVTKAADSEINDDNPKYLTSEDVKTLPTSMQVNLSETNNWTHTWKNLPTKYFYKTADGSIKETDIHYTVEEVQTDATKAFYGQVTESNDGTTTTILNKKKDQEDKPFIEVTKTFKGLTKDQIQELAEASNPYTITLIHTKTNTTKPLTMDVSELDNILQGNDEEKVWTYTWKLEDYLDGTYKVSESNYSKEGYDVTVTVNGQQVTDWTNFSVGTNQATISEYKQSGKTTTCSPKGFTIGKVNLIVAKLTANEEYFVWTNTPVSISERKEIVKLINDKIDGIKGIGFSPEAELQKCYFYSGDGIKDTLVFRNGEIKYDGMDKLTFDASKQWSMFAAGTYTETQNAEIQITNTYSEQTADLDLIKTSEAGTKFDGAEFKLYKKNDEGAYELQKFEYTDKSGKNQTRETIQVINTEGSEAELKNLQSGQYYLEEVKAPEACMLLADKIYFKQEKGNITLTDKEGKALPCEPTMWTLSNTDRKYTLTVKNEILYSLPSAGGTGIYLYMIGGMLLMFAAVWILYKNKCKEVLEK
ncbi:SpaA isopeptide-forming pilin-related protein [Coprococcus comes]|uniref:SpaA isopeptide-forming pilin-related protein n=1 Tax=Coprococcus comes TaxID=410072 RepID=UPI00189D0DAA|nr:SpaA isopeptide-forming pilin-related protein [Coprococcus comes]